MRLRVRGRNAGSWLTGVSFTALLFWGGGAAAQAVMVAPPPTHYSVDPRGVDVISGKAVLSTVDATIGDPSAGGLSYARTYVGGGWRDNATGTVDSYSGGATVSFGGQSEAFTLTGSGYVPTNGTGGSLSQSGSTWTYVARDGTTATFSVGGSRPDQVRGTRIASLTRPNGETLTYDYLTVVVPKFEGGPPSIAVTRLESVTSNLGYQLVFSYAEDNPPSQGSIPLFTQMEYATALNLATGGSQSVGYASGAVTRQGITTNYGFSANGLTSIRRPTSTVSDIVITYDGSGRVATWSDNGNTWTYSYSLSGTTLTTTVTNPLNKAETWVSNITNGRLSSYKDALNHTTSYEYDSLGRLTRATLPEGNYTEYLYDSRGNLTRTTNVSKSGPNPSSDIVTTAAYPTTCANPVTCNQPTSTTDPLGRVTDYTYDSSHGGPLTITEPAPTTGAVRPQTRFTYQPLYAWYGSGPAQAPSPVTHLTQVSRCATTASCAGTADEIRTTIGYGVAGVANNRLPVQVSEGSGNGALTATTTVAYTPEGDVQSVDGPLSGTADTTTYRYDAARRQVGAIGPDPDGVGPLKRRAIRNTYNQDSQVVTAEQGTVEGLTDPNWAAFVSLQQVSTSYDTWGRPSVTEATGGGTVFAVQQASYDAAGRLDCIAARMNPALFDTLPATACTAGTVGPFGPDRISKNAYDAAGHLLSVTTGYGAAPVTESATYTDNGQPLTLTDGEGNVSTMVYDGFDRVTRLRYPNPSGGGSSTTDYENYTYDKVSNVTVYLNRGGDTLTTTYDALNRPTLVDAPSGTNDLAYTYDNLGRVLTAISGSQTLTYVWDALGRQTSEMGPLGMVASQYDLAGRRTRLTWPGSPAFYVQYDYDLGNNLTAIRENGATSGPGVLVTYAYDNLGRRTAATSGNGAASSWGYDATNRLTSLTQDLAGSASDLTLGFSYNPAGQIVGRTVSNDTYLWASSNSTQVYANNGLNQVTSAGGSAVTYDGRENINAIGSATYGYNANNQLTSVNTGAATTLSYDPVGRLHQTAGSTTTRFLYNGAQAIAEYDDAGALQRRFIPGLGLDETVVSYEGSGTTDRRWLYVDERGSVIGLADGSGVANINRYDEYGVPSSGNAGRFQYTGQMWLEDAGLYHYKSRAYLAHLGRFLQPDPIGYQAGANLYAYVGGDPVNLIDSNGTNALCMASRTIWTHADGGIWQSHQQHFWAPCLGGGMGESQGDGRRGRRPGRPVPDRSGEFLCSVVRAGGRILGPGDYRLAANVNAVPGGGLTYNIGTSFTVSSNGSIAGSFSEQSTESHGFDVSTGVELTKSYRGGLSRTYAAPTREGGHLRFRPSLRVGPGAGASFDALGVSAIQASLGLGASVVRGDTNVAERVRGRYSVCP